jgi:hypothetical protein
MGTVMGLSGFGCITSAASGINAKWMMEEAVNDESNQRSIVI